MIEFVRETGSLEDCMELGRQLGRVLRAGDVVLLDGPLGAGKTTLVRAVAAGLGFDPRKVSSPTFVVVNAYERDKADADQPDLVHVDAYRLQGDDEEELELLGWDRVVDGESIAMIEWASRITGVLAEHARGGHLPASIKIAPIGESERELRFRVPDEWDRRDGYAVLSDPSIGDAGGVPADREDTMCPVTGVPVAGDSPTWPYADERTRMADLYKWFNEEYRVTRPIEQADLEQGE